MLYKIARVVIGENKTFVGGEEHLARNGIKIEVLQDSQCEALMKKFIDEKADIWCVQSLPLVLSIVIGNTDVALCRNEDIGV